MLSVYMLVDITGLADAGDMCVKHCPLTYQSATSVTMPGRSSDTLQLWSA